MVAACIPGESRSSVERSTSPWLLIFNCQAGGLGNCLTLLNRRITVDSYDPVSFNKKRDDILRRIDSYERIIIAPNVENSLELALGQRENVWRLPTFFFPGFHPDHCNLSSENGLLGGPLSGNFSVLSYAAFCCGLDERRAIRLFREDIYERMGYFSQWDVLRREFIARFKNAGFDIEGAFVDWTRHENFTYIPSHPNIRILRDIAKCVLKRAGLTSNDSSLLPHDSLANAVVFPVYPEIGSRLGVRGNYLFKPPMKYEFMDLEQFVAESFSFYRSCKNTPTKPYEAIVARAIAVIGDEK